MTRDTVGGFDLAFTAGNVALCYALTIALIFIASVAAVFCTLPEAAVSLIVSLITYICIGICGLRAARHSGANGLLSGALSGLIYVVLLYIAGCLAFGELNLTLSTAINVFTCILCGAVGGVIGINTRHKKRR